MIAKLTLLADKDLLLVHILKHGPRPAFTDNCREQFNDSTTVEPRRTILSWNLRDSGLEKYQVSNWELLALINGSQFLSLRTGESPSLPHQSALAESRF